MKITKAKEWLIRAGSIVIGLAFAIVSLAGILQGIYWVPWFSHTGGEQGVMPLGFILLFGALLTVVGIFARDSKGNEKRNRR